MATMENRDRTADESCYEVARSTAKMRNRTTLFETLATAGITTVIVCFDGSGDSGQIENIEARKGDLRLDLPKAPVLIAEPDAWGSTNLVAVSKPIVDLLDQLAYDFLDQTHGGWENNDGAWGEFTFDVTERTISLDYNERYTDCISYHHDF